MEKGKSEFKLEIDDLSSNAESVSKSKVLGQDGARCFLLKRSLWSSKSQCLPNFLLHFDLLGKSGKNMPNAGGSAK